MFGESVAIVDVVLLQFVVLTVSGIIFGFFDGL